ncbi:MAG: Thymidylate kinase [Rickettsiaceae bacterium]|jgi:dTMP kinase|nr:Thymidylate kinase [Rickettsiaceae bacterium]
MSRFITFEGIEGSGKSTQAKLLYKYFSNKNIPAILTREPGGTPIAEEIRNLLVNGEIDKMDGVCEALLNFAARRNHVEKLIKPALSNSTIVISDRFFDSTIAYQGFAQDVGLQLIKNIRELAIGHFKPDLTILIDVDVETAFERIKSRADNNRYEKMDKNFHQKVREGFLEIAKNDAQRIKVIDGNKSEQEIHQMVLDYLSN